ncbi:site-specific DNA-methyltransferase [Bathymodiolus septemdierum thioautotrophic gill symbiont]|uniref:site-specific DNA-methyltransferase (adenine-specific) n=1 Tax=endosymbiont of Bathymodiolus septemdierum str. Myojin knoll TaxID=1303921 RepID=A0A0N7KBB7_9GAMM|nr:site-specific DNA-methyltransferase [Bathymodiolus septemdierum thioautotrophic gill symbiont]BAS67567.1 adenine-specific DNA-methyltransferase [endosymbiont of Bathymodiolus septemdierum str. Myojin knoll]
MKKEKTFDNSNTTTNSTQLEILKTNFPQCFDKNGSFIPHKMQDIVAKDGINLSKESYSLNWLGKSYARLLANEQPLTLLKEDKNHNQKPENINSENLLIKGDNLEVLKHLRHAYSEQVKMIYIDPPYNTGNDGFVYQDDRKFTPEQLQRLAGIDEDEAQRILDFTASNSNSHSAWLTFIYPRLYIARELLTDDGVIFISIDDNEQAQLKLLCDEVFGEENFVASLATIMNLKGNNDEFGFAGTHENTIVFAKQKDKALLNKFNIDKEELEDWSEDDLGFYKQGANLKATGMNAPREKRPNLYFPIFIDIESRIYITDNNEPPNFVGELTTLYPITNGNEMSWRWSKDKFKEEVNSIIVSRNGTIGVYKKQRPLLGDMPSKKPKTTFYKPEYSSGNGTAQMKKIFNERVFSNPKPLQLLQDFVEIGLNKNDIILDFFAGSGTTADAVMQLNAEDGGNRQCISVQLAEPIDEAKNKTAYDFVKEELGKDSPTVFDITKERILRAGAKIQHDNSESKEPKDLSQQDFGFKVYETLPMFDGYFDEMDELNAQQALFDGTELSSDDLAVLLTSWMVNDGIKLTKKVEKITLDKYTGYYADEKLYFMDKGFSTDDLKALLEKLDNDKDFQPNKIILFGYNFESKHQREISEALNSYTNKKQIELDKVVRY